MGTTSAVVCTSLRISVCCSVILPAGNTYSGHLVQKSERIDHSCRLYERLAPDTNPLNTNRRLKSGAHRDRNSSEMRSVAREINPESVPSPCPKDPPRVRSSLDPRQSTATQAPKPRKTHHVAPKTT